MGIRRDPNIAGLRDVQLQNVQDSEILKYNSTNNMWENAPETGGSGGGATVLNELNDVSINVPENKQTLVFNSTTGDWENKSVLGKTVLVRSLADFPTPTGDVITLADGTDYVIQGSVDIGISRLVIPDGASVILEGNSALQDEIVSNTTGSFITGTNARLTVSNLDIHCNDAEIFNVTGGELIVHACVVEAYNIIGTFNNINDVLMDRCVFTEGSTPSTRGMLFMGSINIMNFHGNDVKSFKNTLFDLGTSSITELDINNNLIGLERLDENQKVLAGLDNNGNIDVANNGFARVINNRIIDLSIQGASRWIDTLAEVQVSDGTTTREIFKVTPDLNVPVGQAIAQVILVTPEDSDFTAQILENGVVIHKITQTFEKGSHSLLLKADLKKIVANTKYTVEVVSTNDNYILLGKDFQVTGIADFRLLTEPAIVGVGIGDKYWWFDQNPTIPNSQIFAEVESTGNTVAQSIGQANTWLPVTTENAMLSPLAQRYALNAQNELEFDAIQLKTHVFLVSLAASKSGSERKYEFAFFKNGDTQVSLAYPLEVKTATQTITFQGTVGLVEGDTLDIYMRAVDHTDDLLVETLSFQIRG